MQIQLKQTEIITALKQFITAQGISLTGKDVSISLYDPADPAQGVIYTMKKGDGQGCSGGAQRSLSIAVQCPASGALGQAVFPTTVTDLGNCAYATTMTHPAACPYSSGGTGGRSGCN
jgi:hypothetical protein